MMTYANGGPTPLVLMGAEQRTRDEANLLKEVAP